MKKRFLKLLSIFVASVLCVFSLSACGCNEPNAIAFNENFIKGYSSGVPSDYFEELTYKVCYKEDMYGYSVSDKLSKNDFSFGEGVYKTELKRLDTVPLEELKNNDILASLSNTQKIYSYKTIFTMPVTYFEGTEQQKEFIDTIETIAYFCAQDMSFAPIYSATKADYSVFSQSGEQTTIEHVSYLNTVVYNKETYTSTTTQEGLAPKTITCEYDFKCLVDNTQLLFALRNFEVTEDAPKGLDVVSPNYDTHTTLGVYFDGALTEKFTGTVNDKEVSEDIKLNKIYYKVNSAKTSGKNHYAYIHSAENNGSLLNNAYVYKYVQPLIEYGSFEVMGSLEFTLVSINQA